MLLGERFDNGRNNLFCHTAHVGFSCARDRMRNAHARHLRHAEALSDKVALGPEVFGDKGYCWNTAFCYVDAVTHGAGSAAASVPVGSNSGLKAVHFVEHGVGCDAGCVVLVELQNVSAW